MSKNKETDKQMQFLGKRNIEDQDFEFVEQGNMAIYFKEAVTLP